MTTIYKSHSPSISLPGAADFNANVLSENGMSRLVPTYHQYTPELKVLNRINILPSIEDVYNEPPETMSFYYQVPGVEPDIAFPSFIKGAAICSLTVEEAAKEGVRDALISIANSIIRAEGSIPPIDIAFRGDVEKLIKGIVSNNDMILWRNLVAFTLGAYWLLSHMHNPFDRDSAGVSPFDFINKILTKSAELGYHPR